MFKGLPLCLPGSGRCAHGSTLFLPSLIQYDSEFAYDYGCKWRSFTVCVLTAPQHGRSVPAVDRVIGSASETSAVLGRKTRKVGFDISSMVRFAGSLQITDSPRRNQLNFPSERKQRGAKWSLRTTALDCVIVDVCRPQWLEMAELSVSPVITFANYHFNCKQPSWRS